MCYLAKEPLYISKNIHALLSCTDSIVLPCKIAFNRFPSFFLASNRSICQCYTKMIFNAYSDLSHTAPYLLVCSIMFAIIIFTATAAVLRAAGRRSSGGCLVCSTVWRRLSLFLFGAFLNHIGLLANLCCWTSFVF